MTPLLVQFLSESRELLDHCSDTFLQLEKDPADLEILNHLFRYVHTIKGGSGLFDIEPFTQLVHVAEDTLSKARENTLKIDSADIDVYLQVLDQLCVWLSELEANGHLSEHASLDSANLISKINGKILKQNVPDTASMPATTADRLPVKQLLTEPFVETLRTSLKRSMTAALEGLQQNAQLLVYRPPANAFFSGDDPVGYWANLPDTVWQGIDGNFADADLASFDPYECRLTLLALTYADEDSLKHDLDYIWQDIHVHRVASQDGVQPACESQQAATEINNVLQSQWQILQHLEQNPSAGASIKSVEKVFARLSDEVPALKDLPPVSAANGTVDPDFLHELECMLSSRNVVCGSEKQATQQQPVAAASEADVPERPRQSVARESQPEVIRTVKVEQEKLEQLVDLTGELIVAKNSLNHLARKVDREYGIKALTRDIKSEHAVLNRITESMQDVVMQIRMIPVSTIFQRFPRLVRDLSRRLGKEIDLQVCGEETEADKNIVEQLADPLIHLVRNSIDHGIEMPDVRSKSGKHTTGVIRLQAKSVQDSVQIEIHDDGAGIDPSVIRTKAIEKGLISQECADGLSDEESLQLIFEPGFSTREEVSDLSGRGVGMDVVKTTVAKLGGTIELNSTAGQGSVVRITLPASITISRVMMFELNEQVYGIPVEGLTETIKIQPEHIRRIKQGEAYVLRDSLIPLYRMHRLLGLRGSPGATELPILNLNINGMLAGFAVDKLLEGVDVIIKPLEGIMARFPLYSGAAVLGDGRVLLVINPKEMSLCH